MKDPFEVLQKKEQELLRLKKEIDALKIVAELLSDDTLHTTEFTPKKMAEMS